MTHRHIIGILGGMGPQAGIDLMDKITAETRAIRDQDHLPVILISKPDIPDRTAWLADRTAADPAPTIVEGFVALERAGAGVAAMACNTAHTPAIFDRVRAQLKDAGARIRILHLVEETVAGLMALHPDIHTVGVLGTHGTLSSGLYHHALQGRGLRVLSPEDTHRVSAAIYDADTGIKARSSPVTPEARLDVQAAVSELIGEGAEAVILGCTELPLAVPESSFNGVPLIDPARTLARALIRASDPARLRSSS